MGKVLFPFIGLLTVLLSVKIDSFVVFCLGLFVFMVSMLVLMDYASGYSEIDED